jgi:hypothetical protein
MDADIAAMTKLVGTYADAAESGPTTPSVMPAARPAIALHHLAPERFLPGADLPLVLKGAGKLSAQLFYRHVNHGERWRSVAMDQSGDDRRSAIPGDYTRSPYPLQYYFVLERENQAWMYPGFNAALSNQPYFAVWKRG